MQDVLSPEEPLGHTLIKKGFRIYFFTILIAPAGYFIKVIISNTLSVSDIGIFYSILGLISILSLYNDFGLIEALQYFIPQYRVNKEYNKIKTLTYLTWISQFVSGIIISSIIYFSSDWLAIHYFHMDNVGYIIKLFAFYFFGINFIQAFMSFFIAFQDTFNQNIVDLVRNYVTLCFTCIFWLLHTLSIFSFTIAWLIGISMSLITGFIIFRKKYSFTYTLGELDWNKDLLKKQMKYAIWVFLGANAGMLFPQVNQQMVIYFMGAEQAGYYTNYYTLFMIYGVIVGPILGLLFPLFTQLITQKNHHKLEIFQNLLYKYFMIFAFTISGLFLAFGPEIATIFFGTKFYYSGQLISYSAPFLVVNMMLAVNYSIMAGLGKVKQRVKYLAIALAINIVANIIFLPILHLGLIGTIISTILGRVVLRLCSLRVVNKNQQISFDWLFLIKNLSIIVCIVAVFIYAKGYFFVINNNYRFSNIMYICIAALLYYGIVGLANIGDIKSAIKLIKGLLKK